jgi:hypothetical protein
MQEDIPGGPGGSGLPQQRGEPEPGLPLGQHVTISRAELGVEVNQNEIDPPNHAVIQPGLFEKILFLLRSTSMSTGLREDLLGGESRGDNRRDSGGELLFRGPQDHGGEEGEGDQDQFDEAQDAQVPPQQKLPSNVFLGGIEEKEKENLDTQPIESLHEQTPQVGNSDSDWESWANKVDISLANHTAKFGNLQGQINQTFDGINSWKEDVDQIRKDVQKFEIEVGNLQKETGNNQSQVGDINDELDHILRRIGPHAQVTWLGNVLRTAQGIRAIVSEFIMQHVPVIGDALRPKMLQLAREVSNQQKTEIVNLEREFQTEVRINIEQLANRVENATATVRRVEDMALARALQPSAPPQAPPGPTLEQFARVREDMDFLQEAVVQNRIAINELSGTAAVVKGLRAEVETLVLRAKFEISENLHSDESKSRDQNLKVLGN